jgi:hypothetical protein
LSTARFHYVFYLLKEYEGYLVYRTTYYIFVPLCLGVMKLANNLLNLFFR